MTLRLVALVVGAAVALYRYRKHRDEWGSCAFYGLLAASAVVAIAGFGDAPEADYGGMRASR